MTNTDNTTYKSRKRADIRVWFEDGSRITFCNVETYNWIDGNHVDDVIADARQKYSPERGDVIAVGTVAEGGPQQWAINHTQRFFAAQADEFIARTTSRKAA